MMKCDGFIKTTHLGQEQDSCLKCGRSKEAHESQVPLRIAIFFGGKLWKFKNWAEANKKGFYLG